MTNYVSNVTIPTDGGSTASYDIRELFPHVGNCTVAAAAAAKTVTIGNFKLYTGAWVVVKFSNTNSADVASLTLNVDGTGAKPIKYRNANLSSAGLLIANRYTYFIYDGTNYQIVGDFDTKVTQSETTATDYRPIVFGATHSTDSSALAATITAQTYVSKLLYAQPQDGILYANRMYLKAPGSKGQLNLLTSKYNVMLRNDDSNTYFLVTAQNDPTGTWTSARPLTINNSTGVCNINGTSSSWATARTLTLGGQLTGSVSVKGDANMTLNGYLDRAFIYDDNAVPDGHTWAEYAWHKFAEVTIATTYTDCVITFLVSRTFSSSAENTGILSAKLRTNGSKAYESAQLKWLVRNYGLSKDDFVMVYTSTSGTSTKAELWCRLPDQYSGLIFTVLKEHLRHYSTNASWTLVKTPDGTGGTHGSSSYPTTGITGTIISSDGTIANSTTGTATSANALNLTHDNELNFSKLDSTGHVWFGYRWNTQGTETSGGTTITTYKFGNASGTPSGLAGIEASTSTFKSGNFGDQLIVERTGGANMAGITFKNTNGMLGYIAANEVDGDLFHYGADTNKKYTILDTNNLSTYVKASSNNGKLSVNGSDVTVYTHPTKTAQSTSNFYKITVDATGHVTTGDALSASNLPSHTHNSLYGVSSTSAVPVTTLAYGQLKVFYNVSKDLTGNMPATNNANAIIQINKHGGDYDSQLGFSSNGNIYYRSCNGTALSASVPWKRIYDTSNPPTASEVGALASTTKYAASSSVGGPALSVSTAGGDVVLGTSGSSSNDSGDIVWNYGNGKEKARLYLSNTYTAKEGPLYRIFKSDGTGLYSGRLPLADGTSASGTWGISITGNAATATTATKVATEVGSSAGARPVFYAYLGDNTRVVYNTNFTYNPSGNVLTATTFAGALSGNASTATKLETARNIALAEDFAGSANFDGSGNISISGTFYRCSATSNNTANYPWHRIAYRTGVTGNYNDTDAIFMIRASYNGGPFGIIKVTMRTNGSGANCQVAARWLVRQNIAANDVYIAQWGKTGQSVYADIFLKGTTYNRAYVYQIAGSRLWTLVNSNEASDTTTSDKKTSTEVYASIAAAGTTLHNQAYTQTVAGIDEGHVNSANSATYATRADYVNVVSSNEIRFYNNNQLKANDRFWIGYSWAQGSHYTPSGGSDTSSTTAPNITKFLMGNCSQGGLASVHAKTFILGNGSSPTHTSKTTTIATAATTTDRTITLPDASGTLGVAEILFNTPTNSTDPVSLSSTPLSDYNYFTIIFSMNGANSDNSSSAIVPAVEGEHFALFRVNETTEYMMFPITIIISTYGNATAFGTSVNRGISIPYSGSSVSIVSARTAYIKMIIGHKS